MKFVLLLFPNEKENNINISKMNVKILVHCFKLKSSYENIIKKKICNLCQNNTPSAHKTHPPRARPVSIFFTAYTQRHYSNSVPTNKVAKITPSGAPALLVCREYSRFQISMAKYFTLQWRSDSKPQNFHLLWIQFHSQISYLFVIFSWLIQMSSFLHQRPLNNILTDPYPLSPRSPTNNQKPSSIFNRNNLLILLFLLVILGIVFPYINIPSTFFFTSSRVSVSKWRDYTLSEAVANVAKNGTVIVCAVSQPYLPFLNNWLISIARQKNHEKVLVIAEDYATLYKVNERWPGHAVLVPPAPDAQTAHKFGSQV